jgi:transcriptional regulator with XRE-family HTH domain
MKTNIFLNNLKEARINRGFNQKFLAKKIGTSQSSIAKWESGKGIPNYSQFLDLCKLFNVNPYQFAGKSKPSKNQILISPRTNFREVFPKRLKQVVKESGLMHKEIAEELNVARNTVTTWINGGAYPNRIMINKIADIFNTSSSWLMGASFDKLPTGDQEVNV